MIGALFFSFVLFLFIVILGFPFVLVLLLFTGVGLQGLFWAIFVGLR